MRPDLRFVLAAALTVAFAAASHAVIHYKRGGLVDFVVPLRAATRLVAREPLYRADDGHYQYKYLPAFAVSMVPFTWIPKEAAEAVWFALSFVMAAAFVRWAIRELPSRHVSVSTLTWLTVLLTAKFLIKELGFGQFNLPFALLFWGAVIAGRDDRGPMAAALAAAALFVKPYALVLLPWLAWTQRRRWAIAFTIVLASGLVLPAAWYGWEGNAALLRAWYRTVTDTTAPNLATLENISFMAFWARWFPAGPRVVAFALGSTAVSMIAGIAMLRRRSSVAEPNYLEGAYFSVLVPLVSPQGWDYVLLVALPAYVCVIDRWRSASLSWRVVTSVGLLLTSFGTYELMRRTVYFHVMGWGGGTIGAALIAVSLLWLRWRALA